MRKKNKQPMTSFFAVRSARTSKSIVYIEARDEQQAIARARLVRHRVKYRQDEPLAAMRAGVERRRCAQFPDRFFRVYDEIDN